MRSKKLLLIPIVLIVSLIVTDTIAAKQQGSVIIRDRNSASQAEVTATGALHVTVAEVGTTTDTNIIEILGNAITVGNGTTDTGTQRVTISSDTTGVLSVDDNGASLSVDRVGDLTTPWATYIRNDAGSVSAVLNNPDSDARAQGAGAGLFVMSYPYVYNGNSAFDRQRTADLSTLDPSSTLTSRNSIGAIQTEKGGRWGVTASPSAGSQGTISIAAEASVRHVADCISFSGGSTSAPALTALTVDLRDGATGAGTILQQWTVIIPNSTGQNVPPFGLCGLGQVGTTNTALTLEFSAALANLFTSVSLTGYNVN